MGAKAKADWASIEAEWLAGQLTVSDIARMHGVTPSAIQKRASRYDWPPRDPIVTTIVTTEPDCHTPVTIDPEAVGLAAFGRVMQLLRQHRSRIAWAFEKLEELQAEWDATRSKDKPFTAQELEQRTRTLAGITAITEKLGEMERRAFGLGPSDLPSEADTMSNEELATLEKLIKSVVG